MAKRAAAAETALARAEELFGQGDVKRAISYAWKARMNVPWDQRVIKYFQAYRIHSVASPTMRLPSGDIDWHKVLGVAPTTDLDSAKKKFKALCLLTHPDKNPSIAAEGAFQLVVQAWDAISSEAARSTALSASVSSATAAPSATSSAVPSTPKKRPRRASPMSGSWTTSCSAEQVRYDPSAVKIEGM